MSLLVLTSCRSALLRSLESPLHTCRVFAWDEICCRSSKAAICVCLATGACTGSVTQGLLGNERHVLLENPAPADFENDSPCSLQTAQLWWLALCEPTTSPSSSKRVPSDNPHWSFGYCYNVMLMTDRRYCSHSAFGC